MEDLENRLSAMGFREVQKSRACWQVSQVGATAPTSRRQRPGEGIRFCVSGFGGSAGLMHRRSIEYGGPCRVGQTAALQFAHYRGEMEMGRALEPLEPVLIEERGKRRLPELDLP